MVGLPWMLAFALRADGWWLRSDIIWHKPNPMPESVTDRPTKSHEHVFMLAKSERYYWDAEAVKEPASTATTNTPKHPSSGAKTLANRAQGNVSGCGWADAAVPYRPERRNIRDVWTIPTRPYPEAHFATFPPELVRPCILAGTSERGVCGECGAPWRRVVERTKCDRDVEAERERAAKNTGRQDGAIPGPSGRVDSVRQIGWEPTCKCGADTVPAAVLDPFLGSGTTALVALQLGRNAIGIELNPEYAELARKRCAPEVVQGRLTL
jgi:hypothetical protein